MTSTQTRNLTVGILFVVLLFACAALSFAEESAINSSSEQALLNAIHSPELRKIMRRLDMLAYENEYTELELESMRVSQLNRLLEFTDRLAATAQNLPEITDQDLSLEDKITFRAMAAQLKADTIRLRSEAAEKNYHNMSVRYRELRQTCDSCHRLFRESK